MKLYLCAGTDAINVIEKNAQKLSCKPFLWNLLLKNIFLVFLSAHIENLDLNQSKYTQVFQPKCISDIDKST